MNIFKRSLVAILISSITVTAQESDVEELTREAVKAIKK